jgi:hypothetical protein
MTLFVIGTSVPQVAWLYLVSRTYRSGCLNNVTQGVGIRCLFQRGVHRRRPEGQPSGAEKELWKRAFWYTLDTIIHSLAFTKYCAGPSLHWNEWSAFSPDVQ